MIISKLILKNWKNFRKVDVDLVDRVFIVGPNASGKSNLLDVFRFLRDIAKSGGGIQEAVKARGGVSKIRCLAARTNSDIEIEVICVILYSYYIIYTYVVITLLLEGESEFVLRCRYLSVITCMNHIIHDITFSVYIFII